jgi:hypothetical protein
MCMSQVMQAVVLAAARDGVGSMSCELGWLPVIGSVLRARLTSPTTPPGAYRHPPSPHTPHIHAAAVCVCVCVCVCVRLWPWLHDQHQQRWRWSAAFPLFPILGVGQAAAGMTQDTCLSAAKRQLGWAGMVVRLRNGMYRLASASWVCLSSRGQLSQLVTDGLTRVGAAIAYTHTHMPLLDYDRVL